MRILYGYSNCTDVTYNRIVSERNVSVLQPDQKYHGLLIKGLAKNGAEVRCISGLPINRAVTSRKLIRELVEYYKAADIFVHPTSYDVWGLVVNEAMACGLPVVVSDHCVAGLELIRNGENGYRIPMGNDQEMCKRVVEIMNNSALYEKMSLNVLETIRPYTMSNMAKEQINAIKEIVGE